MSKLVYLYHFDDEQKRDNWTLVCPYCTALYNSDSELQAERFKNMYKYCYGCGAKLSDKVNDRFLLKSKYRNQLKRIANNGCKEERCDDCICHFLDCFDCQQCAKRLVEMLERNRCWV